MHDNKPDRESIILQCLKRDVHPLITGSDVFVFAKSSYHYYCNKHVPESEKDPPDEFFDDLSQQGILHEKKVLTEHYPDARRVTLVREKGFESVIGGMHTGVKALLGAPLFYLPIGFWGIPDILERRDGRSIFGDHHYVVKDVKLTSRIKYEHKMQVAFYTMILGHVQNRMPEKFYLIDGKSDEVPFRFEDHRVELEKCISGIKDVLQGHVPSPTYNVGYPWKQYSSKMALKCGDISILSGIGGSKKTLMNEAGIHTVDDILGAGEESLAEIRGIGETTAKNYVQLAMAAKKKRPILKKTAVFPDRKTEIFLDLEGISQMGEDKERTENLDDYMIGMVVRENCKEGDYVSFVADNLEDGEEEMLRQFLKHMEQYDDYVIYHWGSYERTHLKKMMDRYNIPQSMAGRILSPKILFDLLKIAKKSVYFHLPSASIKHVARWRGYEWKHGQEINATNSITLYLKYAEDNEAGREGLEKIRDYNEDDCRATAVVKDWLAGFKG